jgi:hypothetical protein
VNGVLLAFQKINIPSETYLADFKGIVSQDVRGVKGGINREVFL